MYGKENETTYLAVCIRSPAVKCIVGSCNGASVGSSGSDGMNRVECAVESDVWEVGKGFVWKLVADKIIIKGADDAELGLGIVTPAF